MTFVIKRSSKQYKTPQQNINYIEILDMPFIFNLQTVSSARRRRHSSQSRSGIVGCGREVTKWA
jgi:hypothetical protein